MYMSCLKDHFFRLLCLSASKKHNCQDGSYNSNAILIPEEKNKVHIRIYMYICVYIYMSKCMCIYILQPEIKRKYFCIILQVFAKVTIQSDA